MSHLKSAPSVPLNKQMRYSSFAVKMDPEILNKREKKSLNKLDNFTIDDITVNSRMRFKIDREMALFLEIDEWASFKEVTLGFLKFNKKTKGDFYDRASQCFNAYKYPVFLEFFPHLLD